MDAGDSPAATVWSPPHLGKPAPHAPNTAAALDAIAKVAQEEGFAQGQAEGYQAGLRQAQDTIEKLNAMIAHLSRPLAELDIEIEHALTQLAVQVARKLVNEDLQLHPEHVAGAVHQAIATLSGTPRELKIHVHPQDAAILRDTLTVATDVRWALVPDGALARGDCRIVTESGQVDGRLDTRQANVAQALLGSQI